MRSTARMADALRGHTVAVTVAGAAAALLGAGTASAATIAAASHPVHPAHAIAGGHHAPRTTARRAADRAPAAAPAKTGEPTPVHHAAARPDAGAVSRSSAKPAAPKVAAKPAAPKVAAKPAAPKAQSWSQIEQAVARQTGMRAGDAANQLKPVGASGTQAWMPINSAQLDNATTIVKQALAKRLGLRSAVIAVATSMQEAQLQNIDYGTSDSLGLFQQQPDCGWGTAQQVMNPKYSADAFLSALERYQGSNPHWASQPLWQAAQGVQHSAFPFAYAKWETQAAHLVRQIVTQVK
jgi:hypothetical protein